MLDIYKYTWYRLNVLDVLICTYQGYSFAVSIAFWNKEHKDRPWDEMWYKVWFNPFRMDLQHL